MIKITKTKGSITTNNKEINEKHYLFTYSEEEKQQNEINEANAKAVFSPKFIPFYASLLDDNLTNTDVLIFGFIDFYTSTSNNRFYFTNEQIASILRCSPDTVSRSITKLEERKYLKTRRKVRAGGGQIRFISRLDKNYKSDLTKTTSWTRQKLQTNKNKINKNKINKNKIKGKEKLSLSNKSREEPFKSELEEVAKAYAKSFKTKKTPRVTSGWSSNYAYWRDFYSKDDILGVIDRSWYDPYWRKRLTLPMLFKRKSASGEGLDRVGELLVREKRPLTADEVWDKAFSAGTNLKFADTK